MHILSCGNSSHDWVLLACPIVLGDEEMVIKFAGEGGHAPMMQVGLVFVGSTGTFEGGFYITAV